MSLSDAAKLQQDLDACFANAFGLDQPTEPTHVNYRHDDGSGAHAFMCTELMRPRSYYPGPAKNLPRCRITINPDGSLS